MCLNITSCNISFTCYNYVCVRKKYDHHISLICHLYHILTPNIWKTCVDIYVTYEVTDINHVTRFWFTPVGGTPLYLLSNNIIFGNMSPVWTYSLFKVIPPTSFWMTPRLLVVLWAPLCHTCSPPVVFQP